MRYFEPVRHVLAARCDDDGRLVVVCDDGSVWQSPRNSNYFSLHAAVPGTPGDVARQNGDQK